jgi:3-phosphoshikimate 1-carboxyvinyltransferase
VSHLTVNQGRPLHGAVRVPGDKSISHRSLLLGSLAGGPSHISGFLPSADCLATLGCLRDLGVDVDVHAGASGPEAMLTVHGVGLRGLLAPRGLLDCSRSGTTMRLLAGILAGQSFDSSLSGDEQLLRRPMRRIADPLARMGADIETVDGHGPLTIRGHELHGHDHTLQVASAQVKSALLLAGLYADGPTIVRQPGPARDHTERMLSAMGADVRICGLTASLHPTAALGPLSLHVPGDISSAAFPIAAALLVPASEITFLDLGVNPTRTGFLDVLHRMGADITIEDERTQAGEPVARVTARASDLHGVEVGGETVVRMIDEFPALAVVATQSHGTTVVRDAAELRVKETDRIATTVAELQALGARIEPLPDGFVVEGPTLLQGGTVDSHGDHRLAMALAVAGLVAQGEVTIQGANCIGDSFPGFVDLMRSIGARYD